MKGAHPPASFDPPQPAPGFGATTWFRVFRCATCRTALGRQRIGVVYARDEHAIGLQVSGYTIERVELVRGLIALDPFNDGLLRFGLPRRAYMEAPGPPEIRRRSPLRRSTSVLPSVEGGDPYHVTRHDPRRARTSEGDFVLALSGAQATLPCVVTCPKPGCRGHWLAAGVPAAAELEVATPPASPL